MKAKDLYLYFREWAGDFDSYWEPETDHDDVPDVMAIPEELERRLRHAAEEVARMQDPELVDEAKEHAEHALSDLRYVQDSLDVLEVMRVLDEGEGDELFWYILGRLALTDYQNLYSFWTRVREEAEEAG